MQPNKDYYETLGISRGAGEADIRKAYRRLARKHHPDLNPGDKVAEQRFRKIQEAYSVLSDPKKRQMYDQHGFYSESGFAAGAGGPHQPGPEMGFGGFDFSDMFTQSQGGGRRTSEFAGRGGGGFRDLFGQYFGQGSRHETETPQKGADLEYSLSVDFWQAVRGTQVRLSITRWESCGTCSGSGSAGGNKIVCPQCAGTGNVNQTAGAMRFSLSCPRCEGKGHLRNACPTCRGEGRVTKKEGVEVRIPQGVQEGSRLRVAGKGNAGTQGAPSGDLYITVRVEPHSFFHRRADDIDIRVPITVSEAGLGTKIEVPTIDGRALLKVPQGTQNNQKFRLREKGVFNAQSNTRGDQIVEVVIQAPKVRDERTKEILRELAELDSEDPRAGLWTEE